jgi:single-strand DNA-binding protein
MTLAKIVISGRVVKPPEKRFTPNTNVALAEFTIAVESATRPDGSTDSTPVKVITWRELAERCSHELRKNDLVIVDGRLQINSFSTAEGQRRREPEIEALAVENLTTIQSSPSPGPTRNDVFEAMDEQLVGAGTTKPSDNIFATEDEIPF